MTQVHVGYIPGRGDVEAEAELNAFLRGKRVVRLERAFDGSGWSVLAEYVEGAERGGGAEWKGRKTDYKAVLDPEAFARFVALRERRKAIGLEDGVPPYVVMTDAQMAEAAKAECLTEEVLRGIEGWGEKHWERYGERMMGGGG